MLQDSVARSRDLDLPDAWKLKCSSDSSVQGVLLRGDCCFNRLGEAGILYEKPELDVALFGTVREIGAGQ